MGQFYFSLFIIAVIALLCYLFDFSIGIGADVITVDGCEYVVTYRNLVHKGDCSNEIHKK